MLNYFHKTFTELSIKALLLRLFAAANRTWRNRGRLLLLSFFILFKWINIFLIKINIYKLSLFCPAIINLIALTRLYRNLYLLFPLSVINTYIFIFRAFYGSKLNYFIVTLYDCKLWRHIIIICLFAALFFELPR